MTTHIYFKFCYYIYHVHLEGACVISVHMCLVLCLVCVRGLLCTAMPVLVKRRVAKATDTQDRYLSGIRPVRFMAICSESVHPLAIMEWLEEKVKLQVQQKSIQLSRTIQPFPLQGVLAPNLCLLTLLHSSPTDSPLSSQTSLTCHDEDLFWCHYWEGKGYITKLSSHALGK